MTQKLRYSNEASVTRAIRLLSVLVALSIGFVSSLVAQIVPTGAGAYTTTLPAGAAQPQSTIYTTATGPVPTHKYWSSKLWTPLSNGGGFNMIPQPLFTNVSAKGMLMGIHGDNDGYPANDATAIAFYQYPNFDLTIGNASLNATSVPVSASSDWSADFNFGPSLTIRTGRGMPFAYELTDGTPVTVTFARTPTVVITNKNVLAVSTTEGDTRYTNYYGLFCPANGTWAQSGNTFTCNAPSGANYASVALLPGVLAAPQGTPANGNQTTIATQLADFSKVAFSFPTNTAVSWNYNPSTAQVSTTYTVTTKSMDGTSTGFLSALYPHQYDTLSAAINTPYTYLTNHGVMKVNSGTSFTTIDIFHGILPFTPPTTNYSTGALKGFVDNSPPAALSASDYEQGKILGAAAQVLPLAQLSDPAMYTTLQGNLQSTLQTWFTATSGGTSDLFYYNKNWGTLIGYPASFDSDDQLNDHHFHYGYFIQAAAMNGLFNPTWVTNAKYGGMVRLLQQDIANYDRTNTMFPFLRHFDVYAGHSWASGQAPFADGENEESSSEAVNAWTGMILLGAATGDTQLRDAGIWLYTQETKAVAYYWFNQQPSWINATAASTFPSWFAPLRIANAFDDKGDTGTFFGANPDFEHGIEFLPFTGGSFHLGLSPTYVGKNYAEDFKANGNKLADWPDLMVEYEALSDPQTAWTQWQTITTPTDGETLAHEYAWINSLRVLGQVVNNVTANTPFYQVFKLNSTLTHVAFNPSTSPITVTFSDGAVVMVPADTMTSDNPLVTSFTFGAGTAIVQPPAAPTGVSANVISSTEIDLSWTLATGVTYNVYRGTTNGFIPSTGNVIASGVTAASYKDVTLSASTAYYYVVEAVNSGGNSAPSAQVTGTTQATASGGGGNVSVGNTLYLVGGATATKPSLLSFTNGTAAVDQIPVNNPQSPNTPANPLVYKVTGVTGTYNGSGTTAFDLFVDAGTNAGEAAQVEVLYDFNGSGTFTRTELYSLFATNAAVDFEDYGQTSRGGLISASGPLGNMTNGTIEILVWDSLPGANGAPIALTVGNTPTAQSNVVIPFTNLTQALAAPVTPTGLTATAASNTAINISWTASTTVGVTYSLYRSTTAGFTPSASNLLLGGVTTNSYQDANLLAATTYYYVVEAVNALGASAPSNQASATTTSSTTPVSGSNTLFLVGGATATNPSLLSFVGGPAVVDSVPVNNPQSPDTPLNPLVYTMTGVTGTYQSSKTTAFNLFVDAGTNVGEGTQIEVLYDLTGSGTFSRTELYHFFGTDPVLGYEDYQQTSQGGLETATGTLGNMTNGTIKILVWNALPGPNAVAVSLSTGVNALAQSNITIPFTSVTQSTLPPSAPTGVAATAMAYNTVSLTWNASVTTGVSYNVYRSTTSGFTPGSANLLANVGTTTYTDATTSGSTTYYYVVAATNAIGTTAAPQVAITTPAKPLATTVSLTLSAAAVYLNGTETLTATVTPSAATGTITFQDGSATLKVVTLAAGVASYTTGPLAGGPHSFSAVYSGDKVYATSSSTSTALSVPLVPPDFGMAVTPASTLVAAGSPATYTLNMTPIGGFNSAITFSCSGLPALSACSFSPATLTLNGSTASSSTMTITTTNSAALKMPETFRSKFGTISLACLPVGFAMFLFGVTTRRKALRKWMLGSSMLSVLILFAGCGGTKTATPTSISTVTITATSGATVHTTTVTLDVQQY